MNKIIIYDDNEAIVAQVKTRVRDLGFEPICFNNYSNLKRYIHSNENWLNVKALVWDLAQEHEDGLESFEILEEVNRCYLSRRVPIFIHSAFADQVQDLEKIPCVFIHKKGTQAINNIKQQISILHVTGFIDLFSEGESLDYTISHELVGIKIDESSLKNLLHEHFMQSFKNTNLIQDLEQMYMQDQNNIKQNTFNIYMRPCINYILENFR